MRNSARFIPSLFTVLNLFCGFLSVISATSGDLNNACLFIIYAALFDAFDGVVARFTGTSSKFGVELDSLADVISFGFAPSVLLYQFYFNQLDGLGIALAALPMIFAALRLARFNAQLVGFDKNYFIGVPVPVSAITIASFFLFHFNKNFSPELSTVFVYIITFLLPLLMISKFKYDITPKFSMREFKARPVRTIIVVLIIIIVFATRGEGLFAFCMFYLITGIYRGVFSFTRRILRPSRHHIDEEESLKYKTNN